MLLSATAVSSSGSGMGSDPCQGRKSIRPTNFPSSRSERRVDDKYSYSSFSPSPTPKHIRLDLKNLQ